MNSLKRSVLTSLAGALLAEFFIGCSSIGAERFL